jgi:hypothetical protein
LSRWIPVEEEFTRIFRDNKWNGKESVSGGGSDLHETEAVRNRIPSLLRGFNIHSMFDIPCGDFNWMRNLDLEGIDYTGADIVEDLIRHNSQYEAPNIHFCKLNLLNDALPKADLVFCRDCLVHFSIKDVTTALRNICNSGSTYLLATTFTDREKNSDIATGSWRPLNLEAAPFSFPPPLGTIDEKCSEGGGKWKDKSLGLWRVTDIAACLARCLD